MCTILIEALTPLNRASCIKTYRNNVRSRLFCRIAKTSIHSATLSKDVSVNQSPVITLNKVGHEHTCPNVIQEAIFEWKANKVSL